VWQLIFDLLRAHDLYEKMPVKDGAELTAATNAIRDAAKARGYATPVQEFHVFTDSGSAQRETPNPARLLDGGHEASNLPCAGCESTQQ
jgi:hypothetical protein